MVKILVPVMFHGHIGVMVPDHLDEDAAESLAKEIALGLVVVKLEDSEAVGDEEEYANCLAEGEFDQVVSETIKGADIGGAWEAGEPN